LGGGRGEQTVEPCACVQYHGNPQKPFNGDAAAVLEPAVRGERQPGAFGQFLLRPPALQAKCTHSVGQKASDLSWRPQIKWQHVVI
jgi:hypothetical protein